MPVVTQNPKWKKKKTLLSLWIKRSQLWVCLKCFLHSIVFPQIVPFQSVCYSFPTKDFLLLESTVLQGSFSKPKYCKVGNNDYSFRWGTLWVFSDPTIEFSQIKSKPYQHREKTGRLWQIAVFYKLLGRGKSFLGGWVHALGWIMRKACTPYLVSTAPPHLFVLMYNLRKKIFQLSASFLWSPLENHNHYY